MITRADTLRMARAYAQAHVAAEFKGEAIPELADLIMETQRATAEECAVLAESITQVRDHPLFRGMESQPATDTEGWREPTSVERSGFRAAAKKIRAALEATR